MDGTMIKGFDLSRFGAGASRLARAVVTGAGWIGRVLTLSVGHDAIWPQRSLSVCIEQGRLSVIHGARFLSRIRVRGVRVYPFDQDKYPQPDALARSVRLGAAEMGASLKNVALVVPRSWVIARTVELPLTVKENLSRAVSFELDRFTPLAADDAVYDFLPVSENEEKVRLFLAVCRADVINPYIKVLEDQGIKVGRVATSLSAMATCCSYLVDGERTVFAEVRPDGYDGGLLVGRRMVATFGDVFNGEGSDERARRVKEGMARVAVSMENGAGFKEAVKVRDGSITPATLKRSMASAMILDDLDRKKLHVKESVPVLTLAETGSVVESLWPKAQAIDLLAKGVRKKGKSPVALTVLLLAAIVAMAATYVLVPLSIERRRLEEIDRQIKLMKAPVRQVEALKKEIEAQEKEIETLEGFKRNRILTIDIMREITKVLPKNAWLTRARVTETGVDLEGYAGSASDILPKLEASPFLKKVEFASPTFRDTRLNADRFVIKMEIENEKKPDTGGLKDGVKK
jgi:Tfp pilus assembly protein PilN